SYTPWRRKEPMGSDMVVALGPATVDGHTLLGHNSCQPDRQRPTLVLLPGRRFATGETLHIQRLEILQPREVYTLRGKRPHGQWGFDEGVNEHRAAVSCVPPRPAIDCQGAGLTGADLVRLALERSRTALQAVDLLTGLVERYGQGGGPDAQDHAFLVADPFEAYAVETAGIYWVHQEIHEVRCVSSVRVVRQDWDRIAGGLATHAIGHGWWPGDGSKLDFAGALAEVPSAHPAALRRWGHATLCLQEQNGHIDLAFFRRLLTDHEEGDQYD